MIKNKIIVGILSIGSGIAQSIINSCHLSNLPLYTIGYGNNPFAFGAYDCDEQYHSPSIYSDEYIPFLLEECVKRKIDILFPGLDHELLSLATNRMKFEKIGTKIIISNKEFIQIICEKGREYQAFSSITDVFIPAYSKESFKQALNGGNITFPCISKPKSGSASRGIQLINTISDLGCIGKNDVLQELLIPNSADPNRKIFLDSLKEQKINQISEISIQILIGYDGKFLGKFASINKLVNGVPIEIVPIDNITIWEKIDPLIPQFIKKGLRGPLNLQGRFTDDGLKIFEVNARITGISGLRALLGFNEIDILIKNYLLIPGKKTQISYNKRKIGIRQVSNKVIDFNKSDLLKTRINNMYMGKIPNKKKTVLITGGTSYIGKRLINQLLNQNNIELVYTIIRNKDKAKKYLPYNSKLLIYTLKEFEMDSVNFGRIDIIIHCAAARIGAANYEFSDSMNFNNYICNQAAKFQIDKFINLSSQAVYGTSRKPLWNEKMTPSPESVFGATKVTSEILCKNIKLHSTFTQITSLRLAQVIGYSELMKNREVPHIFLRKIINHEEITVFDGTQTADYIHLDDVVDAIITIIESKVPLKSSYNLGSGNPIKLENVAIIMSKIGKKYGYQVKKIKFIKDKKVNRSFGMSMKRIFDDFNWKPKKSFHQIIESMFKNQNKIKLLKEFWD